MSKRTWGLSKDADPTKPSKKGAKRQPIGYELNEDRIMTDTEIDAIASLLFTWWKREFEKLDS